ncbi:hypothetical protein MRX96_044156 [Rhipicephalus microplus]
MSLDVESAYTKDEACSVSGDSAIQDDHPDSRVHVAKCWNSAGAPCCHGGYEPWTRLFLRAESDRHLDTSVMQAALTVKTTIHLRDALPCVFAKAESVNNTEDMAQPSGGVLMHYEEAEAKSGMHDGGACAEHHMWTASHEAPL